MYDEESARQLKSSLHDYKSKVLLGMDGLNELVKLQEVDTVVIGIPELCLQNARLFSISANSKLSRIMKDYSI